MKDPWVVTIHIEEELNSKRVEQARLQDAGDEHKMFRVPSYIRKLNSTAYKPVVLFVGLYNRNSPTRNHVDEVRLEVANYFLELMKEIHGTGYNWDDLCLLVAGPPEGAEALQKLYSDEPAGSVVCVTSTAVRGILTLDAVFLTNLLLSLDIHYIDCGRSYDTQPSAWTRSFDTLRCVFQTRFARNAYPMFIDIWLFENQVPLSMVRNVWNQVQEDSDDSRFDSFLRDTIFAAMKVLKIPRSKDLDISFKGCSHLLHCLHKAVCRPSPEKQSETLSPIRYRWLLSPLRSLVEQCMHMREIGPEKNEGRDFPSLPSVSELLKEGIVVRGRRESVSYVKFAPSTFYKATLYLPQIDIDDVTERILQNLVVFESICLDEHKFIPYISIMNSLINTEEDVRLLRKGKAPVIVMNHLGDDKSIATLFNSLLQNIGTSSCENYLEVIREVNRWRGHERRLRWIWFIERFVDQPWILVSLIAGTLLLIMTVLQTTYTVLAFYKQ